MSRCTLGVGCDEAGVCYASVHHQPDQCGRTTPAEPAATDEQGRPLTCWGGKPAATVEGGDAELGRMTRAAMGAIRDSDKGLVMACSLLLIDHSHQINAARGYFKLDDVSTTDGKQIGTWAVTVEMLAPAATAKDGLQALADSWRKIGEHLLDDAAHMSVGSRRCYLVGSARAYIARSDELLALLRTQAAEVAALRAEVARLQKAAGLLSDASTRWQDIAEAAERDADGLRALLREWLNSNDGLSKTAQCVRKTRAYFGER